MEVIVVVQALVIGFAGVFFFWQGKKFKQLATAFEMRQKRLDDLQAEYTKLKTSAKEPTYDTRELLHDLTEGNALVKITRISPLDVFIRRS